MNKLALIPILAALLYGGNYYYQNHYEVTQVVTNGQYANEDVLLAKITKDQAIKEAEIPLQKRPGKYDAIDEAMGFIGFTKGVFNDSMNQNQEFLNDIQKVDKKLLEVSK